jgi:hypothetical protein
MAEEGVANSAPEVEGGAESAIAGVEEGGAIEARLPLKEKLLILWQAQTSLPSQKRTSALIRCGHEES